MKLGLFGGTFDPPHIGHLIVAQDAFRALGLDRVVFIPAAMPPHKRTATITDPALRLAMVQAAIDGDDRFEVDDLELIRPGPSYTVDTLRAYRAREPAAELFFLLGADQFADVDQWHDADGIRSLAVLGVLERQGDGGSAGAADGAPPRSGEGRVVAVPVTRIDISSSDIRRRTARAEPIRYLVPAAVEALIRRHRLYADHPASDGQNRRPEQG